MLTDYSIKYLVIVFSVISKKLRADKCESQIQRKNCENACISHISRSSIDFSLSSGVNSASTVDFAKQFFLTKCADITVQSDIKITEIIQVYRRHF